MNRDELLAAWLDGELEDDARAKLAAHLDSDAEFADSGAQQLLARRILNSLQISEDEFADEVLLSISDRLQNEISAAAEPKRKIIPFPARAQFQWLASAAAVILLLVGIWQFWPSSGNGETFVSIVRVEGTDLKVGERKGRGPVEFGDGMVRILFDSGVEVTLQGPAEFELVEDDRMILSAGLLTANVPPGAEGFRVDTPTAQVTDLGTAFGIHLGDDGASHVSVFDGEVEVEEPHSGITKMLTEGEEVVVTSNQKLESVSLDLTPYEKMWPVSTGIKGSTGSFELAPPWPRRMPLLTSDEHVFVAPDGYRKSLEEPLKVNVSKPGAVAVPDDLSPKQIPAGTPLRSYILHYRPEIEAPRRFPIRLTGSITFDQPIAGVIVLNPEFAESAGRFSKRKTGEMHPRRELELVDDSKGDRVELSADMRTLTVDLAGSRKAFDVIRVVVDASAPSK